MTTTLKESVCSHSQEEEYSSIFLLRMRKHQEHDHDDDYY